MEQNDAHSNPGGLTRRGLLIAAATAAGAAAIAACSPSSGGAASASSGAATPAASGGALDVRMITPPKIVEANLGTRIHCYRPLRRSGPNLTVETVGDTVVAHNYGHGGSGWTLAPGSAKYVVDEAEQAKPGLAKDAPITVVGAGVIGLFTAYELQQRGYTNVRIVAREFSDLTSHRAAGLLAPVSMDNNPEMQAIVDQIGLNAYRFYASIAKGTQPDFGTGARIMPAYFENREESGLEPYVGKVMEPAKDVVLDFGNGTQRPMVAYDDGIFMDTGLLMTELTDYLKPKMDFVQQYFTDLGSLDSEVVFDCTGLGAATLDNDPNMVSVQGHLIMLKDQTPADLQHMILVYFHPDGTTTSGQKVKRSFYMMPKALTGGGPNDVGTIGGTFIEGATPETPNDEEYALILEGAREFYGI